MKVSGSTSLRNGQQPGYPFIALICWNKYSAAASEGTFFTLPIVVDGSVPKSSGSHRVVPSASRNHAAIC
jgi:hypothetical protein